MPSTGPHHRQSRHGPHRSLAAVVGVIPHLCEKLLQRGSGAANRDLGNGRVWLPRDKRLCSR